MLKFKQHKETATLVNLPLVSIKWLKKTRKSKISACHVTILGFIGIFRGTKGHNHV